MNMNAYKNRIVRILCKENTNRSYIKLIIREAEKTGREMRNKKAATWKGRGQLICQLLVTLKTFNNQNLHPICYQRKVKTMPYCYSAGLYTIMLLCFE